MADLKITKPQTVKMRAGTRIKAGTMVYYAERKGILPKLARFIGKRLKIKRLSDWGYEAMPATWTDVNLPIGVALDEKTMLVNIHVTPYQSRRREDGL